MSLILGNLVLVQCQGIVVGFLASLAGIAMGWIPVGVYFLSNMSSMYSILNAGSTFFYLESIVLDAFLCAVTWFYLA